MKRRRFLETALAGLSGLIVGCRGGGDAGDMSGSPVSDHALVEGQPLRSLEILRNENATPGQFSALLSAAPAPEMLNPGAATPMWLYNGSYPSPLIELAEGQHVAITIDNGLPQDTTIHWHGLTVPANQDGNPMDPVPAGVSHLYEFDVLPGSAGTYWYHPHPHGLTAGQVHGGMFGLIEVEDDDERALRSALDLTPGRSEIALLLQDRRSAGYAPNDNDRMHGWLGDHMLVNGAVCPHLDVATRIYRFRVLNASNARTYLLGFRSADGKSVPFTLIERSSAERSEPPVKPVVT